jgi:hypothetical protein
MTKQRIAITMLAGSFLCALNWASIGLVRGQAAAHHNSQPQIEGVWRGNSVCTVKDSPCRDEMNVYNFSAVAGKPGIYSGTASKAVGVESFAMGTREFKYDAGNHTLESAMPAAVLRFTLDGDKMEGTLTLRDGSVYRRIHLVRGK